MLTHPAWPNPAQPNQSCTSIHLGNRRNSQLHASNRKQHESEAVRQPGTSGRDWLKYGGTTGEKGRKNGKKGTQTRSEAGIKGQRI